MGEGKKLYFQWCSPLFSAPIYLKLLNNDLHIKTSAGSEQALGGRHSERKEVVSSKIIYFQQNMKTIPQV